MKYTKQEDIILLAAKQVGCSPAKMEYVIKNMYTTLREFLVTPEENIDGLLLNEFLKFYLEESAIAKNLPYYKTEILKRLQDGKKKTAKRCVDE